MGESKRALVVAVPRYELEEEFPDLTPAVHRDAELVQEALHSSGYSVEVLGLTPDRPAQRSRIRSAISRICCTAPEDATVLVHFTGHGLSVAGADHLVPADAQLSWAAEPPEVAVDSLIGLDLTSLLQGCRAGTVLLTLDACRDPAGPAGGGSHGGPATNFPSWRDRVAVLFGCGPGQTCGSDDEEGSHFTRALAEALHADTSPRTVAEVITYTTTRTAELARAARHEQTPTPHYAPSGPDAIAPVPLCSGRTLRESWTTAVRDPELWAAVRCDDTRRTRLQEALVRLTRECARWYAASMAGVSDPWADDDYPVRVLTRGLGPLLAPSQTQGGPLLDAGEFAVLAAAPFVREALYALGVKAAVEAGAFHLDPTGAETETRTERAGLEHTFAAHALIWRKGRELAARGRDEEARAVAAWLMHRHVRGREELWDEAYAAQLLAPLATALIGDEAPARRVEELTDELVRVCRHTGVVPTPSYDDERDPPFRLGELVRAGTPGSREVTESWRPRELSWLIAVAGLLGGDLRELPGVLVDNIGVADGLVPRQAVESVRELRWVRDRYARTVDLDLQCPHPAVHAGLEALTGWTDDAVLHIGRQVGGAGPDGLLAHLPERVTCGRLRPQYDPRTKGDAYGVPLMRFGLAEDEMRELLMGTQLYGDRNLALRELYQNALDACRYRQARLRYGKAGKSIPYSWQGEIVFRQGTDDEGRPYVECEDNGVGMGRDTLRGTFSRAGRRFEQSREYRREQARWRRVDEDLRIYPNSRFGVGVFSYFMLADEISISTRATDRYGRAESGRGLRVDIASSGSLFRIGERDESQPGGGTCVRLYLQGDPVDVARELGALVWRSDFRMRVERDGETVREWEPDALYYEGDASRATRASRDLWWVPGKGRLLADGVLVAESAAEPGYGSAERESSLPPWLAGGEEEPFGSRLRGFPFGCVMDLREAHTPDISTSRTRVFSYDQTWVARQILDACARFEPPEWFSLEWLWDFAPWLPEGATTLTERLLAADATVASSLTWDRAAVIPFRRVGYFPGDPGLAWERDKYGSGGVFSMVCDSYRAWRSAVLRDVWIRRAERGLDLPVPDSVEGYPAPQAWESRVATPGTSMSDFLLRAALPPEGEPCTMGELLRRVRCHAITGVDVPEVPDLDVAHAMELDAVDRRLLMGESVYDGMLTHWGPDRDGEVSLLWWLRGYALKAGVQVREALERARRFAAVGVRVEAPPAPHADPPDAVATAAELDALSWHPLLAGPKGGWGVGERPADEEYGRVLRRHAWWGLPDLPAVPDRPRAEAPLSGPGPGDALWEEYTRLFDYPAADAELSLVHLAVASGELGLTFAEVIRHFAPVVEGRRMCVPDLGELAGHVSSRLECELLRDPDQRLWGDRGHGRTPARLRETARAVTAVQADAERVRETLTWLAAHGLVHTSAPALVDSWRNLSRTDLQLLPDQASRFAVLDRVDENLYTTDTEQRRYDAPYALLAAATARLPLGEAFARLAELGPLTGHEVSLDAPLPPALAGVRPSQRDVLACCLTGRDGVVWQPAPRVSRLIHHARDQGDTLGQSLDALSRYAPLGAPWQEVTDDDPAWREHRPTPHDTALFEPDLVGDRPVTPLDLVRVAGRFGWSLDRAWDRLALYRPFGVELTMARPESDTVPTWEDLVLLTQRYTGRAPALTGQVTAEHVAVVAREVGRPTRWVRDRLALYAPLFGLTPPAHCPAEPAPTPEAVPWRAEGERRPEADRAAVDLLPSDRPNDGERTPHARP
ncbi:caspase family protein [Streptomyces sp. NPDC005562]|uniref:HD domain-containing protein n=1 Tax=Streptomyces sp. NPDC005562 TaxID=3154890 RepID=UPI0033B8F00E